MATDIERRPSFFHPLSGLVILAVDWLAFGADMVSGFGLIALTCVGAFCLTFWCIYTIQTRLRGDAPKTAAFKACLGALAAGVPFPIGGTVAGSAILVLSGLPALTSKPK